MIVSAPRLELEPARLVVVVPVRTTSEANAHEHWRGRKARASAQREAVTLSLRARSTRCPWPPPLLVTLSRIAPSRLDSDNHASSLKHVRDAVAAWIGIDDRHDDLVTYVYGEQQQSRAGIYCVRVVVEPRPEKCGHCAMARGRPRREARGEGGDENHLPARGAARPRARGPIRGIRG